MNGRLIALSSAIVLMVTLTSCSGRIGNMDTRTAGEDGIMNQSRAGTERHTKHRDSGINDGKYWASGDGRVSRRPEHTGSEWEKMGRQLRDGFDDLMKGAGDVGRDTKNTLQDAGRGIENAAQNAETDVKRAGEDMTRGK